MRTENLVRILNKLKDLVQELESEIKSDPSRYTQDLNYEEILIDFNKYYETNDDDGDID